jgi:hypothetical protein
VVLRHVGRNQDEVIVATAVRTTLVWCERIEE